METLKRTFLRPLATETGQALGEYGLILGLIAMVCVVALGIMGTTIGGSFFDLIDLGFGGS